jgi:hypothetical protein
MMVDMKELAEELARCGNALLTLSAAMTRGKQDSKEPAKQPEQEAPIPLERVRAVLADKSRLGFTSDVKALLKSHGAQKLSEVNPVEYAALLSEAEALK